jgi:CRP/FNR family transcriptional regulator
MIAPMQWTAGSPDPAPGLPLLAGLPHSELASFVGRSVARHISPGELLFRQGEEPQGLIVVGDGAGEIFRAERGRWKERLGEFEAGDVLAVASTLTARPHLASARALVSTEILLISRTDVRRLCRRHPEMVMRLREQMELRLAGLVRRLAWLAARTAPDQEPVRSREMELSA